MLRTRLLDTSTFRLTVVYLGLFSLSALVTLLAVYLTSSRFMDEQVREAVDSDVKAFDEQFVEPEGQAGGWTLGGLKEVVDARAAQEHGRKSVYLLYDSDDLHVFAGNLKEVPEYRRLGAGPFVYFQIPIDPEPASRSPGELHPGLGQLIHVTEGLTVLVGRDMNEKIVTLNQIRIAISIGIAVMVVLGLVGGYIMSRWMLHRLDVINRTTARIMTGDLSRRIEVSDTDDEFDELGRNVNLMLDRIDRLLASMRQVTDDIAHDLRTPLSRLRSRIEVAMMRELDADATRELLEATIRDADNLIETFNALLSIARAEAGGQRGEWERIDLSSLVGEVFELYEPLAEEKGIVLAVTTPEPVLTAGNRQLVAQAIANLADNAIKYAPAGGHVHLSTETAPAPRITVADDGPGIPADQRERAKERFVRLDATRTSPGSGLGLSLVDAVAKLHGARLDLLDNTPGLKVRLTFQPLAALSGAERLLHPRPAAARDPAHAAAGATAVADVAERAAE